ncbi:glycosyltransferase family 4 protein [Mucilaginibacter calamicampi]|uniref:Glycosyltransferase family 4 protein n=1 Tax=Mucilaginibacter calamicampi TaxID=1302352 RepID=A0ABW2YYA8_9SPHI
MKVAIIARSTLYSVPGGDTVQAVQTARQLNMLGVSATIKLSNEHIVYTQYDLLHFFNLIRPADILHHSEQAAKPFVVSTILVDYSEYDKYYRKGVGAIFNYLSGNTIEYLKTMARWALGRDHLATKAYIWKGQRKSIMTILARANQILPNSFSECRRVNTAYPSNVRYTIVPNGIDPELFKYNHAVKKDAELVLCVARIEGIKNQLNLIKALNGTRFKLILIGAYSPNQKGYYDECRAIAAPNIVFIDHIQQAQLLQYYAQAKVHILPSWFETTGLSSVEAAAMGCNIVITDKGDTREYFEDAAFYCNPASPQSILAEVEKASSATNNTALREKILEKYTWPQAAKQTLKAYQLALQ